MSFSTHYVISLVVSMILLFMTFVICISMSRRAKEKLSSIKEGFFLTPFQLFVSGIFLCTVVIFYPIYFDRYFVNDERMIRIAKSLLLSVHNTMRVFILDGEFDIIEDSLLDMRPVLRVMYTVYSALIYVAAPVLTAGFVLSFFGKAREYVRYLFSTAKNNFYFSELNEKSIALAESIIKEYGNKNVLFAFFDVYDSKDESGTELLESARRIGGVCFQKDIVNVRLKRVGKGSVRKFYFLGSDEDENIDQAIRLIGSCRARRDFDLPTTEFYVFSGTVESEVLLDSIDKGNMKVRRYDESRNSVIDTLLSHSIFSNAIETADKKSINVLIVGLGRYGRELLKTICWFAQMPGYELTVNVIDRDDINWEALRGEVPELIEMSGKRFRGDAYYKIVPYLNIDVDSQSLTEAISDMGTVSTVYVTLGDDELNIKTAMRIRRELCRLDYKTDVSVLAAVDSTLKTSIINENGGIRSIVGADYNIEFFGDVNSIYSITSVEQSEIEKKAKNFHLQWSKTGEETEKNSKLFEKFEYYRRSSTASCVYALMQSRMKDELANVSEQELAEYEHKRWNAYMRAEGYVGGANKDHIGKTHPSLIAYEKLSEFEKSKDTIIRE